MGSACLKGSDLKDGSIPDRMARKCALNVRMEHLAALQQWTYGGDSW